MLQPNETMLIFDLDGTLWNSSANVAESWNIVLRKYLPERANLTDKDIQAVMGKTMEEIAQTAFPDMDPAERKKLFDECQAFENEYIAENGGELFPGVRETLSALKDKGYSMAVVSNCQVGYIPAFLSSMKMDEYFCDIEEWGRTLKPKSENIKLVMERNGFDKAIYLGDTPKDKIAAETAGATFIHAGYGFGKIDDARYVINSFPELADLVQQLL